MNKLTKALVLGSLILGLGACSSMTTVSERETYAMPSWYKSVNSLEQKDGCSGKKNMFTLVVLV